MGESQLIDAIEAELMAAEKILNTEYSFDLAEPNYLKALKLIASAPQLQPQIEGLLIKLFADRKVSDEPIAYLMHQLRWPEVKAWMEAKLRNTSDAIALGAPIEKVLAAYEDDWETKEFYKGIATPD